MNQGFYFLTGVCLILVSLFIGGLSISENVNIDLPEEYKQINDSTKIQGRYNANTNTLTIEFNHE